MLCPASYQSLFWLRAFRRTGCPFALPPIATPLIRLAMGLLICGGFAIFADGAIGAEPEREAATSTSTSATGSAAAKPTGLQAVDWALIVIYAASTIALGWYYSRRQKSTEEYFVGSGHMNPLLIGVSLFATLLSTISYLSMPGEALGKGPAFMATMLGLPFVFLIVGFVLLPVYMRQRVTSAYELLEVRLGLGVRMLGAVMFVSLRLVWMSLLIYLAGKAMTVMLGVHFEQDIPLLFGATLRITEQELIVLATGFVAVVYTSLGGLRAVVITDLMQTILLFGGALFVIASVTIDYGGIGWFPTKWDPNWDTQPFFSFDPQTRVTVVGSMLTMIVWYVCTAGGDQVSVQRFMATRDAQAARRAYATQLVVAAIVGTTLGIVGFALLGYFRTNPGDLAADLDLKGDADHIFPYYIAYRLPVGVSGLVVAAMFAAAMSSLDSGVNSITAVVTTDFLDRFGLRPKSEKGHVRLAQVLAFTIGAVVVVGSTFMEYVPGNITAVTQKTTNLLTTPIFALFFFALFVPFARPAGVYIGAICGTATAALIAFSGPLVTWLATQHGVDPALFNVELITKIDVETGRQWLAAKQDPISFQWIGPMALLVNIVVGTLVSLVLPKRKWIEHAPSDGSSKASSIDTE